MKNFKVLTILLLATMPAGLLLTGCSTTAPEPDAAGSELADCATCPAMIQLTAGAFLMGTAEADRLIDPRTGKPAKNDGPQHEVAITYAFAMGKFEVTTAEYAAFVSATGYQPKGPCMEFSPPESFSINTETRWNNTGFPQTDSSPVGCVSFFDARAYTDWLSRTTGHNYRLPSEAEWEYAARAGSATPFFWGTDTAKTCTYANVRSPGAFTISKRQAAADTQGFPCDDGHTQSAPVGSFAPNAFGLYDMQGNAWEWVADCNHKNYTGAPTDGSPWMDTKGCQFGVIRSGSYLNLVERSSTTVRAGRPREGRATNMGFRVVRAEIAAVAQEETAAANWQAGTTGAAIDSSSGAGLFAANCAACHVRANDYRGLYGKSRSDVIATIRDGGNNIMSMPAFNDRLSALEIELIADYVREQNNWN
jgi:formylglycine-generating enzyme required for sulfatase activity